MCKRNHLRTARELCYRNETGRRMDMQNWRIRFPHYWFQSAGKFSISVILNDTELAFHAGQVTPHRCVECLRSPCFGSQTAVGVRTVSSLDKNIRG